MTQLPATASNVCTTDARLVGVGRVAPPKQKSWLRWCFTMMIILSWNMIHIRIVGLLMDQNYNIY